MAQHNGRIVVTIVEAGKRVGVSRRTIYNWLHQGRIQTVKTVSGHTRIYEDSLWQVQPGQKPWGPGPRPH